MNNSQNCNPYDDYLIQKLIKSICGSDLCSKMFASVHKQNSFMNWRQNHGLISSDARGGTKS